VHAVADLEYGQHSIPIFFSSRRRHTSSKRDWSSDVCSSDLWGELMARREIMFMLLQGYAASDDDAIRGLMQGWTRDVFERVAALPEVGDDISHDFFAAGTLYMVAAAMDLPARAGSDEWARRFLDSGS